MTAITYADILRPQTRRWAITYDITLMLAATVLLAFSSYLAIRLPFSPVPITAQTLVVLLIGATLGRYRGAVAILLYLVEGAAGLPVFANGAFGAAYILGPTGGYLIGFVAGAYIVGYLAEVGMDRHIISTILAMTIGTAVILLIGNLWLAIITEGVDVLAIGFYPFIPGAIVKILVAAGILPLAWKIVGNEQMN